MAGKPEQNPSHPVPSHRNNSRHQSSSSSTNIHQNSVLVYVSGENFAYATNNPVIGSHNNATGYQGHQQQQATTTYHNTAQTHIYSAKTYPGCKNLPKAINFLGNNAAAVDDNSVVRSVLASNGTAYDQTTLTNGQCVNTSYGNGGAANLADPNCRKSPGLAGGIDGNSGKTGSSDEQGQVFPMRAPHRVSGEACNAAYPIAQLPDGYLNPGRACGDTGVGIAIETGGQITFGQRNPGEASPTDLYSGNSVINELPSVDNIKCESKSICNNSSLNSHSNQTLDTCLDSQTNSGSVGRCDSVRSDTAESTYSSLSSPESHVQSQESVQLNSCPQQAVRSLLQTNVQHNVALNMNSIAVNHQQQTSVSVPQGWKRICTNGVIIYIR